MTIQNGSSSPLPVTSQEDGGRCRELPFCEMFFSSDNPLIFLATDTAMTTTTARKVRDFIASSLIKLLYFG